MFGKGLVTGMRVTLKHFFGKKETFCYPEEKLPMPERFRAGHLVLDYKKCIACQLCAMSCPNKAIELKVVTDAQRKRHLTSYVHDIGRCMYCDLCIENCALKGLHWDQNYEISTYDRAELKYDVMKDDDRAYLKEVMETAAANPAPPIVPKKPVPPKPAAPAAKPAEAPKPVAPEVKPVDKKETEVKPNE